MQEWKQQREASLREFFALSPDFELLSPEAIIPEVSPELADHLDNFNLEWHIVPSEKAVPFDDAYVSKLYPQRPRIFEQPHLHGLSYRQALVRGHSQLQGQIIAVESTMKPRYLPFNQQYYGTIYGFDTTADPFAVYMGRAGFTSGTRFAHNYTSLSALGTLVNNDWRARGLVPAGYRVTLCPPAVFNLVGTIFHPEWSSTESLELGFYRDAHDNATCYAVGSNAPGDFSFIRAIEVSSDWTLLGFRVALLPA